MPPVDLVEASRSSGSRGGGLSIDLDEGIVVLVLVLIVLSACLGGVAVWLLWQAPVMLPEAAFEVLVASGLLRTVRRGDARGWTRGVLRSTIVPFLLLLAAASLLGWAAQYACPPATRLLDVFLLCG